jgi:hypothetical protein
LSIFFTVTLKPAYQKTFADKPNVLTISMSNYKLYVLFCSKKSRRQSLHHQTVLNMIVSGSFSL